MKRLIKIIICLFIIGVQVMANLYPQVKLSVINYMTEIDFEKALKNGLIKKYTTHLSIDEKGKILAFLESIN